MYYSTAYNKYYNYENRQHQQMCTSTKYKYCNSNVPLILHETWDLFWKVHQSDVNSKHHKDYIKILTLIHTCYLSKNMCMMHCHKLRWDYYPSLQLPRPPLFCKHYATKRIATPLSLSLSITDRVNGLWTI